MANVLTLADMSPGLLQVVERAKREPEGRFNSLAQLIDVPALERAYHRQRAAAAVGVDGITKEQYGGWRSPCASIRFHSAIHWTSGRWFTMDTSSVCDGVWT